MRTRLREKNFQGAEDPVTGGPHTCVSFSSKSSPGSQSKQWRKIPASPQCFWQGGERNHFQRPGAHCPYKGLLLGTG